mmetsp:Transcript_6164/g.15714  ORF Transcript_6164/g.15714 Transcript_6164/m.15714 type:complete len:307 (-) Transcript_6164:991-1911(-)
MFPTLYTKQRVVVILHHLQGGNTTRIMHNFCFRIKKERRTLSHPVRLSRRRVDSDIRDGTWNDDDRFERSTYTTRRMFSSSLLFTLQPVGELEDGLHLHGPAAGQAGCAHGGARRLAARPEHLHHGLAEAVHHLRLLREVRRAVHEPRHLHHPLDVVQRPQLRPQHGQHGERAGAGSRLARLHPDHAVLLVLRRPHLAHVRRRLGRQGPDARHVHRLAHDHHGRVHAAGRGRGRQLLGGLQHHQEPHLRGAVGVRRGQLLQCPQGHELGPLLGARRAAPSSAPRRRGDGVAQLGHLESQVFRHMVR